MFWIGFATGFGTCIVVVAALIALGVALASKDFAE